MLCKVSHGITSFPIACYRRHSCMFKYNNLSKYKISVVAS